MGRFKRDDDNNDNNKKNNNNYVQKKTEQKLYLTIMEYYRWLLASKWWWISCSQSSIRSIFPISFHSASTPNSTKPPPDVQLWKTLEFGQNHVFSSSKLWKVLDFRPLPYFSTILNLPNISTTT
jgi:hypothetical protein